MTTPITRSPSFCTVAIQIEVWFAGYSAHRPLLSLLALFATIPLAFRCVYPLASYIVIWLAIFAIVNLAPGFDDQSVIFVVVFVVALYSLGANARGRQAWAAAVLVPFAITAFVTDDGDAFHWGDIVFAALIIGGPWGAGLAIRLRRDRERSLTLRTVELERDQDERARVAVAEERARIARELHDVVAHAISVVVVQARGGRKVLDQRSRSRPVPRSTRSSARASRRSARCAGCSGCCATTTRSRRGRRSRRSRALEALADEMRASGLACRARRRRASRTGFRPASTSPATGSCRRP